MKHFWIYTITYRKKDVRLGIVSTGVDLIEGDTDENMNALGAYIAIDDGYKPSEVKFFVVKPISDEMMRLIHEEGVVRGFGNVGPRPQREPDSRSGDGGVSGREDSGG